MSNPFTIRAATRQGVKPLIHLYSESGCGKTMSALLLARGFVGPTGKIGMVDSESGRGELYADVIPGGYDVLRIDPPFTPQRYIQAHDAIVDSGAAIGIIDSASHEWEGIEGVLDMASANEEKSGKPGLHNWKKPKLEHNRFVLRLLQSPLPWVVCLRAKHKSRQTKDERGKTVIVKDDYTSPIQAEDFIYEATAHAEILPDHSIRLTKCSHPSLRDCFPAKGPITVDTGKAIAAWCASAGGSAPAQNQAKSIKSQLWDAIPADKKVGATKQAQVQAVESWLIEKTLMSDTETLSNLTEDRMKGILGALPNL